MINRRSLLLSGAATLLASCRENPSVDQSAKPKGLRLLEPPYAAGWTQAGIPDEGRIGVADAVLSLGAGQPMTGAKFAAWPELALPATGFSIRYEAMRVTGEDFFGTVTFPVPGRDSHVSFVLGGWGGTVTEDAKQIFHSSQIEGTGDNFVSYANPELDKAIDEARLVADMSKGAPLWHKVHQIIHQDQPYTFLYQEKQLNLVDGRFRGNVPTKKLGLSPSNEWYVPSALQKYKD